MIANLLILLGAVAVLEGLVLALAPLRFEDMLEQLRRMDRDTRRLLGLGIVALGVVLVAIGRAFGA